MYTMIMIEGGNKMAIENNAVSLEGLPCDPATARFWDTATLSPATWDNDAAILTLDEAVAYLSATDKVTGTLGEAELQKRAEDMLELASVVNIRVDFCSKTHINQATSTYKTGWQRSLL